jgi:hypothetical protein
MASPIHATLERLTASIQYLGARYGAPSEVARWSSDVVDDADAVNHLLDVTLGIYGTDNRQVAASFLPMGYFWYLMTGALACFIHERRLPDVSAGAVTVDPLRGVTFASPRFFALPDDPDAGHPDAVVVPDLDTLRRTLVETLEREHAEPLFATIRSVTRLGIPGMRANFHDRLVSAILWLAEAAGDLDIARREVPAFVALFSHKTRSGLIEIEHEGKSGLFIGRGGCCLNYHLPGREKCDTCCLRPMLERVAILREHLVSGDGH